MYASVAELIESTDGVVSAVCGPPPGESSFMQCSVTLQTTHADEAWRLVCEVVAPLVRTEFIYGGVTYRTFDADTEEMTGTPRCGR